jgi:hypothetical protein
MVTFEDPLSALRPRGKMRQHVPLEALKKRTGEKSMAMSFFDSVPGPELAHTR